MTKYERAAHSELSASLALAADVSSPEIPGQKFVGSVATRGSRRILVAWQR